MTIQANVDFGGPSRAGQPVYVYQHGTTTAVSIFDHDGVTPLPNPVTTTGNGHVVFQAAAGTYDLVGPDLTRTVVLATDASAASGAGLPATIVSKTTAYTAAVSDFVECDTTSAGFTVTLPSAPAAGSLVAVKKVSNDTNTLTIAAAGSGTIDGQTTVTTITQWAGVIVEHKGSDVWRIAASMTTTGPAGTNGNTVLTTSGAPSAGTGQNGDYAIDPTAHVIYGPKAAGAWPSGVNMLGAINQIQAAGTAQTVRAALNFTGTAVTVTDDAANGRTNVAIAGGGGGGLLPRALRSGGYAAQPGQSTTLSNPSSGYTYVFPFEFFASTSVAAMGINVSTAFAAATIRVGVYSDSAGMPGSLLFEAAGTPTYPLDAGTTGDKMVTLSSPQVIAAGVYWVAFRATTGGSIAVAGTQNAPVVISAFSSAGANQNQCSGYADGGGGAGALNSSLTGLNHQVTVPRVYFKIT